MAAFLLLVIVVALAIVAAIVVAIQKAYHARRGDDGVHGPRGA